LKLSSSNSLATKWCLEYKFELNVSKCKAITFSRRKNPIDHVYRIGEHELERVEEIKDLGVFAKNLLAENFPEKKFPTKDSSKVVICLRPNIPSEEYSGEECSP
jgi:hypothetical protein